MNNHKLHSCLQPWPEWDFQTCIHICQCLLANNFTFLLLLVWKKRFLLVIWRLTPVNFTCWPSSFNYSVYGSWKVFLKFFRLQSVYKTSYWNISELSYLWTFCLKSLIIRTFSPILGLAYPNTKCFKWLLFWLF